MHTIVFPGPACVSTVVFVFLICPRPPATGLAALLRTPLLPRRRTTDRIKAGTRTCAHPASSVRRRARVRARCRRVRYGRRSTSDRVSRDSVE
jgi:hypothetical protein